jgi:hypothetical protein
MIRKLRFGDFRRGIALLLVGAAAVAFAGCAAVTMAPIDQDAEAKKFEVPAGQSRIYVYRNESFGGAIYMTLSLDGRIMGRTAAQTYFMWDVAPGKHTVSSHAEDVSTVTLETAPGRSYYIWQEVKMGLWMARSALQQVDEKTGRAGVLECQLAAPGE